MRCPFCQSIDTKVIDSRLNQSGDLTRRRRECIGCSARFTTYERIEEVMPQVVKKDSRREPFNRDKILKGLRHACQKRPFTVMDLEAMVAHVEREVQGLGVKEMEASKIGEIVMAMLKEKDNVAYVRFASVYRDFQDLDDFIAELRNTQNSLAEHFQS